MFARKRSKQEEEVDRRVQLAKEAARGHAATVAPPAVSQGIANDSPDLMAEEMRRKREFWNDTLRRDRASRGSTRALVGEEDATRLLRPGGMLADPAGEARGLEDGVTSALVRLLIAASKGQLIWRRCNRRNRKSVRQCGIHVSSRHTPLATSVWRC